MITLFGVYGSRATRPLWLLHELDLPFTHVPVIQACGLVFALVFASRGSLSGDPAVFLVQRYDTLVCALATPLIAGPGAIASVILLVGQSGSGWGGMVAVLALVALMLVVTFLFLLASPPLERLLGRTGTVVITRLLGMLLAALAIQFVIDGLKGTGLWVLPV